MWLKAPGISQIFAYKYSNTLVTLSYPVKWFPVFDGTLQLSCLLPSTMPHLLLLLAHINAGGCVVFIGSPNVAENIAQCPVISLRECQQSFHKGSKSCARDCRWHRGRQLHCGWLFVCLAFPISLWGYWIVSSVLKAVSLVWLFECFCHVCTSARTTLWAFYLLMLPD